MPFRHRSHVVLLTWIVDRCFDFGRTAPRYTPMMNVLFVIQRTIIHSVGKTRRLNHLARGAVLLAEMLRVPRLSRQGFLPRQSGSSVGQCNRVHGQILFVHTGSTIRHNTREYSETLLCSCALWRAARYRPWVVEGALASVSPRLSFVFVSGEWQLDMPYARCPEERKYVARLWTPVRLLKDVTDLSNRVDVFRVLDRRCGVLPFRERGLLEPSLRLQTCNADSSSSPFAAWNNVEIFVVPPSGRSPLYASVP